MLLNSGTIDFWGGAPRDRVRSLGKYCGTENALKGICDVVHT